MLSLDLFNTKYERELQEGAVDNLEARRIDDLNMRMLELLDRAKEPAYKKNPGALAGLKKQFQKIKAEPTEEADVKITFEDYEKLMQQLEADNRVHQLQESNPKAIRSSQQQQKQELESQFSRYVSSSSK